MLLLIISTIVCLLGIAALISATETAITAVSPGIIQNLKAEGDKKATTLLKLLKIKDKIISTLLIGNSIANTLCTTIATGAFIEYLGDDYGTLIASIVMSLAIIIFSEVIPKAIAVVKSDFIALRAVPILLILLKILAPINKLLALVVKLFCLIFRIDLNSKHTATDEVRGVIEHHLHEGNVYKDDRDMLGGVLDIRDMVIADIMTHRSNIFAINLDQPTKQIIELALTSTHSRIPFWQNTTENIVGILHIRDLTHRLYINQQTDAINIKELLSEPVFIPDNSLVVKQLEMFREGQTHLACVIDEYGDLQGIITLEDILEEIVGQIYDEHDLEGHRVLRQSEQEFMVDGSAPIRDLNREYGWNLPEDEATTIGGFMINKMAKIPSRGEYLVEKNIKLIVEKKTDNRIRTIKVISLPSEQLSDG